MKRGRAIPLSSHSNIKEAVNKTNKIKYIIREDFLRVNTCSDAFF